MDKSLLVLSYIRYMIQQSTDVETYLTDLNKIYSSVAPEGTTYPYVILSLDNIQVQYTKDRMFDNTVTFTVTVYHNKYADCMYLSNAIRAALENHKWDNQQEKFYIDYINMQSATTGLTEDFNFVTQMTFWTYME